jgi:putative phage-type endonuclease
MHYKVDQNTDEWMELRRGKFTASSFADLFAKDTTAAYQKAIYRVVYERMTGEQPESFQNDYMKRGHELEPLAIAEYERQTFAEVQPGGFWELNEFVGASPDGLVGDDGLIEVKCPAYNTMIEYLLNPKLPSQYKWQVHGQLLVTGRQWVDFTAYHPKLKMLTIRIDRDELLINELNNVLEVSIEKVKQIINKLS